MYTTAFVVCVAFLCLLVAPAQGTLTSGTPIIVGDRMVDDVTDGRVVEIDFTVTISASAAEVPRVCSSPVPTISSASGGVSSAVTLGSPSACSGSVCKHPLKARFVFPASYCTTATPFSGDFTVTYQQCDDTTADGTGDHTADLTVAARDVCSSMTISVTADVDAFGPYADSGFSQLKNPFYINDMVYFPFKVTYTDLTISKVNFHSIIVTGDGATPLFTTSGSDSSPTAAGYAVGLQVAPVITQLNSGTANAWFSINLSRNPGSPFASASYDVSSYTFDVVFDIVYNNAKRAVGGGNEEKQMTSRATIRVSNDVPAILLPGVSKALELPEMPESAAQTLQVGVACIIMSFLSALYVF